jgi:hypothetical protein
MAPAGPPGPLPPTVSKGQQVAVHPLPADGRHSVLLGTGQHRLQGTGRRRAGIAAQGLPPAGQLHAPGGSWGRGRPCGRSCARLAAAARAACWGHQRAQVRQASHAPSSSPAGTGAAATRSHLGGREVVVHPQRVQHLLGQRAGGLQLRHVAREARPELRVALLDGLQGQGRAPDVERKVCGDTCAGCGSVGVWQGGRVVAGGRWQVAGWRPDRAEQAACCNTARAGREGRGWLPGGSSTCQPPPHPGSTWRTSGAS